MKSIISIIGVLLFLNVLSSLSRVHLKMEPSTVQKGGRSPYILAWTHSILDRRLLKAAADNSVR